MNKTVRTVLLLTLLVEFVVGFSLFYSLQINKYYNPAPTTGAESVTTSASAIDPTATTAVTAVTDPGSTTVPTVAPTTPAGTTKPTAAPTAKPTAAPTAKPTTVATKPTTVATTTIVDTTAGASY